MRPSKDLRGLVLGFYHDLGKQDPSVADFVSVREGDDFYGRDVAYAARVASAGRYALDGPQQVYAVRWQTAS